MSGVTVSYSGGNIIVNGNTVADTRSFYSLGLDNPDIKNNDNDVEFAEEHKHLRALDGMKDGKIKHNISGYVYDVMYPGLEKRSYAKLSDLVGKFMAGFANKTTRHTWTKVSKNSPLATKLLYDNVFQDSGLDPKSFINLKKLCGNFGTWADPGYRDEPNYFFPENNVKLVLAESFLRLFGLPGCRVEAKKRQGYGYEFAIHTGVDGFVIERPIDDLGLNEPVEPVEWFRGNKYKNKLINQLVNSTTINSGLRRQIIDGLLKAKGMGDLLMILLMFIWKLLHPSQTYTMGTCDYVVDLQCKIIGLNCCTTRAVKKNGIVQLLAIENFEPDGDTPEKAKLRFDTEKKKILTANIAFMKSIHSMYVSSSSTLIYLGGYDNPIIFSRMFYSFILHDITAINNILKKVRVTIDSRANPATETTRINHELTDMKENFTLDLFFRKSADKLKLLMSKKYTKKDDKWRTAEFPTLPNYGEPFYIIGKRITEHDVEQQKTEYKQQIIKLYGDLYTKRRIVKVRGVKKLVGGQNNDFENLEFDYKPSIVEYHLDGTEIDDDGTEMDIYTGDLTDSLYSKIDQILDNKILTVYRDHFLNGILYHFYLTDMVLYDEDLYALIEYLYYESAELIAHLNENLSNEIDQLAKEQTELNQLYQQFTELNQAAYILKQTRQANKEAQEKMTDDERRMSRKSTHNAEAYHIEPNVFRHNVIVDGGSRTRKKHRKPKTRKPHRHRRNTSTSLPN